MNTMFKLTIYGLNIATQIRNLHLLTCLLHTCRKRQSLAFNNSANTLAVHCT